MFNLSFVQLLTSEGVIACESWPALKDLILYGNPFTQSCKGEYTIISLWPNESMQQILYSNVLTPLVLQISDTEIQKQELVYIKLYTESEYTPMIMYMYLM